MFEEVCVKREREREKLFWHSTLARMTQVVHVNFIRVREINHSHSIIRIEVEAYAPSKIIRSRSSISRFSSLFDFDDQIQFCGDHLRRISIVLLFAFAPIIIYMLIAFGIRQSIEIEVSNNASLSLSLLYSTHTYQALSESIETRGHT